MRNWFAASAIVLTLSAFASSPAAACSCHCGDPDRMLDGVDMIFDGTPQSSVEGHMPRPLLRWRDPVREYRETRFEVTHVWRSDRLEDGSTVRAGDVLPVRTHPEGSMCGVSFDDDAENFVLAHRDEGGRLWASLCSQVCAPRQAALDFLEATTSATEE